MTYSNRKKIISMTAVILCSLMMLSFSFQNIYVQGKEPYKSENDVSFFGDVKSSRATLFVGGTGANNYTTIQAAIDNASAGDTIYVYAGIYYENLIIEKDITIQGEQKETTIIDGSLLANTISIGSVEVIIESFTVQNGYYSGIFLDNSYNTQIKDNIIINNQANAIYGLSIISCNVSTNTMYGNEIGIYLNQFSRNNVISENIIYDNTIRGIYLRSSYLNTVQNCNVENNSIGISIHYCNNSKIISNMIQNHTNYGIRIKESFDTLIGYNYVFNNEIGVYMWQDSTNNTIRGNTILSGPAIPPTANDDGTSTLMNQDLLFNVTMNDFDHDGKINVHSIVIQDTPDHGIITDTTSGVITYQPNAGYNGTDSFTYTVQDMQGLSSDPATVHIAIIGDDLGDSIKQEQNVNDRDLKLYADNWLAQSIRFTPGTCTRVSFLMKKTGIPYSSVSLSIRKNDFNGDEVFTSTRNPSAFSTTFEWIEFDGPDFIVDPTIQYYLILSTSGGTVENCYDWAHSNTNVVPSGLAYASDDDGISWSMLNTSDFCFRIYKVSGIPPLAINDTYFTTQAKTLTILADGVLINDHDPDGGPTDLQAFLQNTTTNGTLTFNQDGSFTYIPHFDFIGVDSFTYYVNDSEFNSSICTVSLHVTSEIKYCIQIPDLVVSDDNYIYHNNLYPTTFNQYVFDENSNIWDNTSLNIIGGNYWGDYNEPAEQAYDTDMNGIFDGIYAVDGGSNIDHYPLAAPWNDYQPNADFDWIPIGPATDLLIQFTDLSTDTGYGKISSWYWDFDDGNFSTQQHPIHQYDLIGNYNVTLVIIDDDGNTDAYNEIVTVSASPPLASFTWDPIDPSTFELVQFNDTSTDDGFVVSWLWDFDDGNTSTLQHPTHQFNDNGVYNVTLLVGDDDGATDSITHAVTILNQPPIAVNDSSNCTENSSIWIPVADNDYDIDGILSLSSVQIITPPDFGSTNLNNSTGTIQYIPNLGYYGNDSFIYQISDNDGDTDTAYVFIQILHINIPPVARNDSYTIMEDTILDIASPGVLANDSDPDSYPQVLSSNLTTNAAYGIVQMLDHGSFNYTPNQDYYGTDTFTYKAYDGMNYSPNATVTITVININDPPIAINDSYTLIEDTTYESHPLSVLDNDYDSDNSSNQLSVQLMQDVRNGSLILHTNGTFSYIPDENFTGIDTFEYAVSDGIYNSTNATVFLQVININDPPIAINDSYTMIEDTTLTIDPPGVLANDIDNDTTLLTAILLSNTTHGSLTFEIDGSFIYIPNTDFYGYDSFTYQAFDGTHYSNTANVTIHVLNSNEQPVAINDTYTINEDTWLHEASPGILGNDYDPDSSPDPITAILNKNPLHGSLTLYSNGSFDYLPDENYSGTDFFTYQAYDGNVSSNTATVTITILDINDAPVAVDNLYSINEDTILNVQAPGVLSNDYDAETLVGNLTALLISNVSNGMLTFHQNGSFTYVPNYNFNGIDTFTYQASDGVLLSNIATVTIIVYDINDVPLAHNDSYQMVEDTTLIVNESNGILQNDTDPDNSPNALIAVLNTTTQRGNLTLYENGSFRYTPNTPEFSGDDMFTYRAYDGLNYSNIATVYIQILFIDDSPVAVDDYYVTMVNETLNISSPGILGNDNDNDTNKDNLTINIVQNTSNGILTVHNNGSFSYIPALNFNGTDYFIYQLFDNNSYSNNASVYIEVIEENIVPIAYNDSYITQENIALSVNETNGVLSNDNDSDNGPYPLSAELLINTTHGYLELYENGSFYYQPDSDWSGIDYFRYHAFDGLNFSNFATVEITVYPNNQPPIALNDSYLAIENNSLYISEPGVLYNDTDPDDGPMNLTVSLVSNVSHGSLVLYANGSFTYQSNPGYTGIDIFSYQAYDGLNYSNIAQVTITVYSGNLKPIAVNDSYVLNEDTTLQIASPGVLSNDYDPDTSPLSLTAVLVDMPLHGQLSFYENGSFIYTPPNNYSGNDLFTYQAYDGLHYSDLAYVTLQINDINDPPIAVDDISSGLVNQSLEIDVLSNDIDIDGLLNTSSIQIMNGPNHGFIGNNSNGMVNYTPNSGFLGTDYFNYTVEDNDGAISNIAQVTITITIDAVDVDQNEFDRGFPIRHAVDGDWAAAQSFTMDYNTLTRVQIYLRKFGSPQFNLTVELRAGSVDGTLLDNVIFTPSEISSSWYYLDVDFNDTAVNNATQYFIVCPPAPSGVTTSFGYEWGYAFGNQYDDGSFWFTRDGGALWRDLPSMYEFTFKTMGYD